MKKGFDFTLMVAGRAGAGQTWARGVSGGDGPCVCGGGMGVSCSVVSDSL